MKVSYVLGTYNRLPLLKVTIESIRNEIEFCNFENEIIVVEGGSNDGSLNWLKKQKDIITIIQYNRGYWKGKNIARRSWGYFMNLGFKIASGKYVCMLSDDCWLKKSSVYNGVELFEKELKKNHKIGAVAFYWKNWPDQIEFNVGVTLGKKMFVNHGLYLRDALEDVGWIDESYHFYHADGDLCLKMWQKGYKVIASKKSFVWHYTHSNMSVRSTNGEFQINDWNRYIKKWRNIFCHDDFDGSWIKYKNKINFNIPTEALKEYRKSMLKNKVTFIKNKINNLFHP